MVVRGHDPYRLVLVDGMGLGYFGQPHIIVRFMAVRTVAEVSTARNYAMSWMGISLIGAIGVGIFGRAMSSAADSPLADPGDDFHPARRDALSALITGFLFAAPACRDHVDRFKPVVGVLVVPGGGLLQASGQQEGE